MITENITAEKKTRKIVKRRKQRKVIQHKPVTEAKIVETAQREEPIVPIETPLVSEQKSVKSAARKERVPFGVARLKLSAPVHPGYKRRWVNDTGGRTEQAEAGGYEFVTDTGLQIGETAVGSGNQDLGSRVSRIVGTMPDGKPQRAYLMEIKDEFYYEDQREKQKKLDVTDNQIRKGSYNPDGDKDTNRYIPSEGISIK